MIFRCPDGFNLSTFLSACAAGTPAVILQAGGAPPDGSILYQSNTLSVQLNVSDPDKQSVVTAAALAQGATPD